MEKSESDLAACTDQELQQIWREKWKGTQREFCDQQQCNRGNFNKWLQGRKSGGASRVAVVRWLLQKGPVPPLSVRNFVVLDADVYVFIDGDNCGHILERLTEIVERVQQEKKVQVLFFSTTGSRCVKSRELTEKEWFVLIKSKTTCKDATDHSLTFWVSSLHHQTKPEALFVLLSRDGFIQEPFEILKSLQRKCTLGLSDTLS